MKTARSQLRTPLVQTGSDRTESSYAAVCVADIERVTS